MTNDSPAEPLYELIRKIRRPETLRELIAACLRSVYIGDPFCADSATLPPLPESLKEEVVLTEEHIEGIRCAIYRPLGHSLPLPVMLYMHGGGFVIGCSEDTDYTTRVLCHSNQVVVVSVNYRLAPETVFPGALDDCAMVLDSVIAQSDRLGIDPGKIYFAGDSAGANLAASLYSRITRHRAAVKGLILFAPWWDMDVEKYESYNRLAPTGIVFDAAFIGYARAAYVGFHDWKNPLASPLFSKLKDMPPTIVLVGTEDSLLDQTLKLRQLALDSNCEQFHFEIFSGMPHCFYSFPGLFSEEEAGFKEVSKFIERTK